MENNLFENIKKLSSTPLGKERIKKNLCLTNESPVEFCKAQILNPNCEITKKGKNFYCKTGKILITVNSFSFRIITAHFIK